MSPQRIERRYERSGVLAIEPQAFLGLFFASPEPPVNTRLGDVEIVDIRGPLDQHDDRWCDSYEAISRRVRLACEGDAKAIVLRIDSPGGEAAGCFEAARSLRSMAAAVGKPLYAYVDGKALSAAYALACAASRIVVSDTATIGSIGVISTRSDYTEQDAARGVRFAVVANGKRKTDGHPHVPISEDELKATQAIVDSIAGVFHGLVAELRGTTPAAVAALEAGVFHGQAAVSAGLVDEVLSFDALLASIAGGGNTNMTTKYEEARKALEEAAKGEGDEAKKAKRALAAMDDDKSDDDDKAKSESDKDDEKAESEGDDKDDDDDKEESKKAASATGSVGASTAADLAAALSAQSKRLAKLEAQREGEERKALFASRPDLDPALVKVLETKPLAEVKAIVDAIPKPKVPKPAAASTVTGTRGEGQGEGTAARLPPEEKARLDAMMGLTPMASGVKNEAHRLVLGAAVPKTEAKTES